VFGTILGIVLTEVYEKIIVRFVRNKYRTVVLKNRFKLYNDDAIRDFIFRYYGNNFADLFDCEILGVTKRILFLTNKTWSELNIDIYESQDILKLINSPSPQYKVNNQMIKKRSFIGQRLFDDDALYLSRVTTDCKIESKKCRFYQKLTLIDALERETFSVAVRKFRKRTKLRDATLKTFQTAISTKNYPVSLGCHVVLIINIDGKKYVALETRSNQTFTYGGSIASVPVFGMVPIPQNQNSTIGDNLKENVLLYNILKEYSEELYNRDSLEKIANRTDPFWFYEDLSETHSLIQSLQEKKSHCRFLGYGFDAINGLSILATMLYIEDDMLSKSIYKNCNANWEIDNDSIMFYSINDHAILDYHNNSKFQNGTAFALALALKAISNYK